MKGISTIIATIVLLLITISLAGTAYMFFSGVFTGKTAKIISLLDSNGNTLIIRNDGTNTISSDELKIVVNGQDATILNPQNIEPGEVLILNFIPPEFGSLDIKIFGSGNTVSYDATIDYISYISKDEYESYSNGWRCSEDLYVLENNKISFFSAKPRTYTPVTRSNCASGVSSYDDSYGASPMRIWAKNTDSSSYKKNTVVIDNTYFQDASVGTFTFSDPNKVIVNSANGEITYSGNTKSNLQPEVKYQISKDRNYVKVTFSVKNVGSSNINTRLIWLGDQDGAGTCRFQSGHQQSCYPNTWTDHGEKWMAEWRSNQDVTGYIVENGEVEIYQQWEGIRVEQTSSTVLSPGDINRFEFYIVSDVKGPGGNEWKPVEDEYFHITTGNYYSCLDIFKNGGGSSDGVYLIDPDGIGGNDPFEVYCDMSTDEGGWTLAAVCKASEEYNCWTTGSKGSVTDPDSSTSTKLSDSNIKSIMNDGEKLTRTYWRQTNRHCVSNPVTAAIFNKISNPDDWSSSSCGSQGKEFYSKYAYQNGIDADIIPISTEAYAKSWGSAIYSESTGCSCAVNGWSNTQKDSCGFATWIAGCERGPSMSHRCASCPSTPDQERADIVLWIR